MITFQDGPAAEGVGVLMVRRAPLYLRVVVSPQGNWDALDQLDDAPRPKETLHAYRREGKARPLWVRPGGRYEMADYRYVDPQPDQATMRDRERWRAWAFAQVERGA